MAKLLLLCASSVTGFSAPIAGTSAIRSTTPAMSLPANLKQTASAVLLAAALVAAPFDAEAAGGRSGGRVGGRTSSAPSRSYSRPATNTPAAAGTTNVIVSPGYGMGYGYGGFGMSPGMTGAYLGLSLADTLIREQQRQAFLQRQLETQRQLGQDQAMIADLQRQISEQNMKVGQLQAQQSAGGAQVPQYMPQGQMAQPQMVQPQLVAQ